MRPFGLIICLTLLITPTFSAKPRSCLVVTSTGEKVVLQCAGQINLRTNDRVRLHAVPQEGGR